MFNTVRSNDIVIANERSECAHQALEICHCESILNARGNPEIHQLSVNKVTFLNHHSRDFVSPS